MWKSYLDFIDEYTVGSVRNIVFLGFGAVGETMLAIMGENWLCAFFATHFIILFLTNLYSWNYQRRHGNGGA